VTPTLLLHISSSSQVPSSSSSQGPSHNSNTASSITRKSESKTHFKTKEEARNKERERDTGERDRERDYRGSDAGCLLSALPSPYSTQETYPRHHRQQMHYDGSSRGQDRNYPERRGATQRGCGSSSSNSRLQYLDNILDTLNNTTSDKDRAALSHSLPIALPKALISDRLIAQGERDRGSKFHNRPSSSSNGSGSMAKRGTGTRSGINHLILMVDEVVSKLS
jgi:hypothetical protein